MLKRKIISQLEEWKKNHLHEALLIKGARQVGKTTTIREFAHQNYAHLVEINFEQDPQAKDAFAGSRDARTVISRLSLMGYGPFVEGKTLHKRYKNTPILPFVYRSFTVRPRIVTMAPPLTPSVRGQNGDRM